MDTRGYYSLNSRDRQEWARVLDKFQHNGFYIWRTNIDFTSGGVSNVVKYSPLKENGTKWFPEDNFPYRRAIPYLSAGQHAKEYFEDGYGSNTSHIFVGMDRVVSSFLGAPLAKNATHSYNLTTISSNLFKVNGTWRLPTTAELRLIARIQADPNSAVRYLFPYDKGWAAETNVQVDFDYGRSGEGRIVRVGQGARAFSCPIFDTYKYK